LEEPLGINGTGTGFLSCCAIIALEGTQGTD